MKKIVYAFLAFLLFNAAQGQGPVRIIGYRYDNYNTSNQTWNMPDSIVYTYPAGTGAVARYNTAFETRTHRDDQTLRNRYTQQFNAQHLPVETVTELWDTGGFRKYYRETCLYNAAGKMTQATRQYWDTGTWVNNLQYNITYDANNDTINYTYNEPDSTGNWRSYSRIAYVRDGQHRVIKEIGEDLNYTTLAYDTADIYLYNYDIDGTLAAQLELEPDNNNVMDTTYLTVYAYNNHQLLVNYRSWSDNSGYMTPNGGYNYLYNSNNQVTEIQNVSVDTGNAEYIYQRQVNNYNSNQLRDTVSTIVKYNGSWFTVQKQAYTYNPGGDIIEYWSFSNSPIDGWHNYSHANYEVNTAHLPVYEETFGFTNDVPYPISRNYYWYEAYQPLTGISEAAISTVNVYPNPAHQVLNVELPAGIYNTATLYNLQGRQIVELPVNPQAVKLNLDISGILPGAYVLCISGVNERTARQIIIE